MGKTKEIERLNAVYKRMLENSGVQLVEGRGSIVDPHTVQVDLENGQVQKYSTKYILVATGGRAFIPDIPGKVNFLLCNSNFFRFCKKNLKISGICDHF